MIYHVKGDLLASDCNFIGHQSNCLLGFGSGIAGQIRKQIPEMYEVFKNDSRKPEDKLGSLCYTKTNFGWGFNLYGQFNYGGFHTGKIDTIYVALEQAIDQMLIIIPRLYPDRIKVGLPWLIGCGLAGGNWQKVYKIIETQSEKHGIDIHLYEYTP